MSHFIAQPKDKLVKACTPAQKTSDSVVLFQAQVDAADYDFSLDCSIRVIKVANGSGLLSRVVYPLPRSRSIRSKEALHYAEVLNCLLVHSRVFVNQDIDGDRRYSLQMDTVLPNPFNHGSITQFLDNIAQDSGVLLRYFQSKVEDAVNRKDTEKQEDADALDMNVSDSDVANSDVADNTVIPFETYRRA